MRHLIAVLIALLPVVALADIAKPATLSDTLDLMLERVLNDFPQARIDRGNQTIVLDSDGDSTINPDNLHAVLNSIEDGAAREAELDRFVSVLMAANTAGTPDDAIPLDSIYPVVRHVDFVQSGAATGLYSEPFMGDLALVYAIDYPDYVAYVTQDNLDTGLTLQTVQDAARENLNRKLQITQFERNGGFYVVVTDGFYESSMITDSALWEGLATQLGEDLVAILPARDVLVFTVASDTATINRMALIRDNILTNGTHPLSDFTYIWMDGAWQVFTP